MRYWETADLSLAICEIFWF